MAAHYKILKSKNKQFYWVLLASNHKVILTSSEQYTTKQNCIKSIKIMKNELCFHLDTKKRKGTSVYFEANNCETLCKTQYYKSKAGLTKGLQSVVINRKAEIKYLT